MGGKITGAGGGGFLDIGIHAVDAFRWLAQKTVELTALTSTAKRLAVARPTLRLAPGLEGIEIEGLRGKARDYWGDAEFRFYVGVFVTALVLLTASLQLAGTNGWTLGQALRGACRVVEFAGKPGLEPLPFGAGRSGRPGTFLGDGSSLVSATELSLSRAISAPVSLRMTFSA